MAVTLAAATEVTRVEAGTWHRSRSHWMWFLDALCITLAIMVAYGLRFGFQDDVGVSSRLVDISYVPLSIILIVSWWTALEVTGTRDRKISGTGIEEYRRIAVASLGLAGAVAVVSYLLKLETARGYIVIAFPLGVALLVLSRWGQRKALHRTRLRGENLHRVLLLGASHNVEHLEEKFTRNITAGYKPVASLLTDAERSAGSEHATPSCPTVSSVLEAIDCAHADTVAVTSGAEVSPVFLRHLGWELAARGIGLIMAPALTDVSGPRIHMQPVAGLPLIHVSTPRLTGLKAAAKRSFDVLGALAILAVLAVPMAAVALLVKLDSPGPALFFHERIGKGGKPFKMVKFRSMRTDAESLLAELHRQNQDSVVFFKVKNDPRITRFGAWIRRYSVDELPQLLNVLNGTMSLVGPRPQVAREVEAYDMASHRRLLVKPGMTGLWQVSGRNDLSVEESIRLDLYYVENWSLTQDLLILGKTARAVVSRSGAY